MFGSVRATPYDMRFYLLGVPVAVTPWFWVAGVVLGWRLIEVEPGGPANLITWLLCLFVSILVHEFGHALTMRAFGHRPSVLLYHFGGLAMSDRRETPGRSFLISAAGPGIQLLLGGAMVALQEWLRMTGRLPEYGTPANTALTQMVWINIAWALVNCLPVLPLDGGRMLESLLALCGVRNSAEWSLRVGVATGAGLAVLFLLGRMMMPGVMFAFLAMENYRGLQSLRGGPW